MKAANSMAQYQPAFRTITAANYEEFPSELQELYLFFQKNKGKVLFPRKYYAAQRTLIRAELCELLETHPDLPPSAVVARIIGDLPDFIPADKIIELTRFTLRTWQALQAEGAAV